MRIDDQLGRDFSSDAPGVRFYTWVKDTISLGYNQNPDKRLEMERCLQDDIDIVKRPTGGRELLHGNDLCYSVIWPARADRSVDAVRVFSDINDILVSALKKFGIDGAQRQISGQKGGNRGPCFTQVDRGEIAVDGRKLIASAQRVYDRAFLQQGSMPLRCSDLDLSRYLKRHDRDEIREKLVSATTCFYEHADETIPISSIVDVFRGEFESFLGLKAGPFARELSEYDSGFLKLGNKNLN